MPKVTEIINSTQIASFETFFIALESGNIEIINRLHFTEAYLNAKNQAHWGPLHLAIFQNNQILLQWLLDQGADPNIVDDLNYTPLHLAIVMNHLAMVSCLLTCNNIKIDIKNAHSKTPLTLAIELDRHQIAHVIQNKITSLLQQHLSLLPGQTIKQLQENTLATITNTTSTHDITYIPDPLLNQQLAQNEQYNNWLQSVLRTNDQLICDLNKQVMHLQQENALFKTKLSFFSQPINSEDTFYINSAPVYTPLTLFNDEEVKDNKINKKPNSNRS